MIKLLFLPGILFLLVIFFRVVLPYIKTAPWKRMIDNAMYYRHRDNYVKSDEIIEKALIKYPMQPQVYLDYFLNHSNSGDLKKRFDVLYDGYNKTGDVILAFFTGSSFLENGLFDEALKILDTPQCREYMLRKGTTLIPEIFYELGNYQQAEEEFLAFYSALSAGQEDTETILSELSPQDLIMLALIRKADGKEYKQVMNYAPKSSVHSNMGWTDLLSAFKDKLGTIEPASSGINGDPGEFNRRRREYFVKRINLIEAFL